MTDRERDLARYHRTKRLVRLPAEPLQELVRRRIREWGLQAVCHAVGVSVDAVRKLLRRRDRKTGTVNLTTADRWASGLGTHLGLLYEGAY